MMIRHTTVRGVPIWYLLLRRIVVMVLCLLWATPAISSVDWDDSFEYANGAAFVAVWPGSCTAKNIDDGSMFALNTNLARVHSGARSLRLNFVGHPNGGCFHDRYMAAATNTLYTRWWMYMDNFTVDSIGTKVHRHDDEFWWVFKFGSTRLNVEVQAILLNGQLDTVDLVGGNVPQNQWVCVETRITTSTPGQANGIIHQWINGSQTMNYNAQKTQDVGENRPMRYIRQYRQDGIGQIYYDQLATDRSARIGCGATPPPPSDTTAPSVPTGLTITWLFDTLHSAYDAIAGLLMPSDTVAELHIDK